MEEKTKKRLVSGAVGLGAAALLTGVLWYLYKKFNPTPEERCRQQGGTWDETAQTCRYDGGPGSEPGGGQPSVPAVPGAPWKVASRAYSRTNADITIAWAPVPGATYYKVWHLGEDVPKATVYGTTQYTQTGAYPGAPWTVAIEACNDAGCSGKGPFTTLYTASFGV